ncbi:polysaccharide lyase family 1 protein [Isoptericola sp. NPDC019482]|uniref:pectate lyase family protein n=1 Tax=Isoptericola sp. NPDC019482 TaxID=3154688 RepID=UPI003488E920
MTQLRRQLGTAFGALTLAAATAAGTLVAVPAAGATPDAAPGSTFSTTDRAPGWASQNGGTDGGAGADAGSTYVVTDRQELLAALDNGGARDEPKIVYVTGTIHGNETDDGRLLGEQDFAPGYDFDKFLSCFGPEGWSDALHDYCGDQRRLRVNGSRAMKSQTELKIPSNTTIVGLGDDAGFDQATLMLHLAHDVVIRNVTVEAPVDWFTWWDQPGSTWDARFDAVSAVTSTNIWVDHVTLTDGKYPDRDAPLGPDGEPANRHDGLFDIEDGSDFITVSNSLVTDHDKAMMLASGDEHGDKERGHLNVSYIGNFFDGVGQRSPRVRFGQVHVLNNYFLGRVNDPESPMTSAAAVEGGYDYFIGLGYESQVLSERNSFDYTGPGADATVAVSVWNATRFADEGSWFKQRPVDLEAIAADQYAERVAEEEAASAETGEPLPDWATAGFTPTVDWTPPYGYEPLRTAAEVERHARTETGAGRLSVPAP